MLVNVPTLHKINNSCVTTSRHNCVMAGAVVLLFLLDSLPDFDQVINRTIDIISSPGVFGAPCKPTITAPVLEVITKKLNLKSESVEKLLNIEMPATTCSIDDKLKESTVWPQKNDKQLQDNFIEESYTEDHVEKNPKLIELNSIENLTSKNVDNLSEKPVVDLKKTVNVSKVDFPETAPFLAAIFETLGNVTAQTCGGVLVSPFLVLTAASCVDVLGAYYGNSSKEKSGPDYSVVIGAKNPLKYGSVHRVSEIYVHPTASYLYHSNEHDITRRSLSSIVRIEETVSVPSLALLRIAHGVEVGLLEVMENKTDWDGVTARLYGWDLNQNESGFAMMATSMPVKLQNSSECKNSHGILENNTTLCLSVSETSAKPTKMISGCPVLVIQNGRPELLAVALADGTKSLLAEPIAAHRAWLRKLAHARN